MKRQFEVLSAQIESLGYVHERTNSKGVPIFVCEADGHEIAVPMSMGEAPARVLLGKLRRRRNVETDTGKRNACQLKTRAQRRRDLQHKRLASALAKAEAERAAILARKRDRSTERAHALELDIKLRDADEIVEQRRRELAKFEALMVEVPASRAGSAGPRHRAGAR